MRGDTQRSLFFRKKLKPFNSFETWLALLTDEFEIMLVS
jgi:hypothetical protein